MMKGFVFSIFLFLIVLSSQSFGALDDYNIFFINGMSSSPSDAKESRQKLRDRVLPSVPNGNVDILYQNNDSALREMIETVRQQAAADNQREIYKSFWKCLDDPTKCDPANPPTAALRRTIQQTLARYDQAAYVQNPQLQAMVSTLRDNYYNKNKKALLVSHSQGNFYANQLVNYLQSYDPAVAACVNVVGVASPATYVAISGTYETRSDDVVINLARADFPWGASILPPTWTPTFPTDFPDPSHHKFIASYLGPDALRMRIGDDIAVVTASTTDSTCVLCSPFSRTASWDGVGNPPELRRYIGPGRRTVNVRFDVNTPNDGYQYYGGLIIKPANDGTNTRRLVDTGGLPRGTYRYSFVFDAAQQGTNEVFVYLYTGPGTSVKVCVDCGNSNASSPSSCP